MDEKVIDITEKKMQIPFKNMLRPLIWLLVVIVILAIAISNLFIVKEGEYKVVRQFGEVVRIYDEPGLNYKIPFIQTHETLPKYKMLYDIKPTEVNTKDKKKLMIDNYVLWRIDNPELMIRNARNLTGAEVKLGDAVYSIIRAELGQLNFDEIINEEKSARGNLNVRVTEKVNDVLKRDHYGIDVIDVRIKRTDLPEQNEQSVFQRMISERKSKAQEYLSQGDAEATKIRAETDRQVQEMLAKAEARAKAIEAEGEQTAAQMYNDAYSKDPEFYQLYRTLQSYKSTMSGEPVIVMPISSPYARYLMGYLQ